MSVNNKAINTETMTGIRIATFNVSMEGRNYQSDTRLLSAELLPQALAKTGQPQIQSIARIIRHVRPDIILLNEFDYTREPYKTIEQFQRIFLQSEGGEEPLYYPYVYTAPVNTGELFPGDLDGDGQIRHPNDTYGFGYYPGQYGMVLLSLYPIDTSQVRRFQTFKWKDMPGALKPVLPSGESYYPPEYWKLLRLSSKSHWDIPVRVEEKTLHLLASHPTPPVFDGPEDRNGRRNHDEIRLWVDYISGRADYLYDDTGRYGSLAEGASFVVLGDLNASTVEGDGRRDAIAALLESPAVTDPAPTSVGAREMRPDNPHAPWHTAAWGMRADYVLPSSDLVVGEAGVFWPAQADPLADLVKGRATSSDHRLVWVDIAL